MLSTVTCLTALLTATPALLQATADENSSRWAAPLSEADMALRGVVLAEEPERPQASSFQWRGTTLPLLVPRDRVAVGAIDENLMVVMAGGIRHALVVYFVDASGAIARLATEDGRRLAPSFNGGRGSWPQAIGSGVFVVAFEKSGRVELRAIGFGDQVFASRSLPDTTTGFLAEGLQRDQKIRIQFTGVDATRPLEFIHPRAPRVEFGQALVDFGPVEVGVEQRGTAIVRNPSSQPIDVSLQADGAFVVECSAMRVEPGAAVEVPLRFHPTTQREHQGRLLVQQAGLDRALVLALRGRGTQSPAATTELAAMQDVRPTGERDLASSAPVGVSPSSLATHDQPLVFDVTAVKGLASTRDGSARTPRQSSLPRALHVARHGDIVVVTGELGEVLMLAAVSVQVTERGVEPMRPLMTWRARLSGTDGTLRVSLPTLRAQLGAGNDDYGVIALRRTPFGTATSDVLRLD